VDRSSTNQRSSVVHALIHPELAKANPLREHPRRLAPAKAVRVRRRWQPPGRR
jgi:hypothetical protein